MGERDENQSVTGSDGAENSSSLAVLHPTQAHYAAVFGVSVRTIKTWIAIGRDARPPERPPLDEPARMKDWYSRHMTNRVPDRLVDLAASIARGTGANSPHSSDSPLAAPLPFVSPAVAASSHSDASAGPLFATAAAATTPGATPRTAVPVGSGGFTATLGHLREAASITGERYARLAADPTKEAEAEHAHRIWSKLTKELLAYEKSAQDLLQSSGQSWASSDVIAALDDLHPPLRDGVLSLYGRLASRLDLLPTFEQRDRLFRDEARRLFAGLVANKFTASPAPSTAAA